MVIKRQGRGKIEKVTPSRNWLSYTDGSDLYNHLEAYQSQTRLLAEWLEQTRL